MDGHLFEIHGNEVAKNMLDFGDKYMHNIVKHSNVFWKDVFQSYLTIFQASDNIIFKQKFFSMPVWYNTNICVGNKTIYVKLWYEHGVKIVSDFLNNDGTFLSQHDFEKQFSLTNICTMQFNSVISAISKFLKTMSVNRSDVSKDFSPFIPFYFEYILLNENELFNCSKQDKKPDIVGMLHHLSFKYKVEKYIAIKSCEITKFNKLWVNWKNIFEI